MSFLPRFGCRSLPRFLTHLVVAASCAASAQAQSYTIEKIPAPTGSTYCYPWGVNDQGDVVGDAVGSTLRPFVYRRGLGTSVLATSGSARDINNSGQAVGYSAQRAILWEEGVTRDLTTYAGPDGVSAGQQGWELREAHAINDRGQVACNGLRRNAAGVVDAWQCLWERDGNGNVLIRTLPGSSVLVLALNEAGNVLTDPINPATGARQPALYETAGNSILTFLPPAFGQGRGLNQWNEGVGGGYIYLPQPNYGLSAGTHLLGGFGGNTTAPMAINDGGIVVGFASNKAGRFRAFRWMNGSIVDLNTLSNVGKDWDLIRATSVSQTGHVIVYGSFKRAAAGCLLVPR